MPERASLYNSGAHCFSFAYPCANLLQTSFVEQPGTGKPQRLCGLLVSRVLLIFDWSIFSILISSYMAGTLEAMDAEVVVVV